MIDDGDDELEVVELLGRVTSYLIPASLTNAILLYCINAMLLYCTNAILIL